MAPLTMVVLVAANAHCEAKPHISRPKKKTNRIEGGHTRDGNGTGVVSSSDKETYIGEGSESAK